MVSSLALLVIWVQLKMARLPTRGRGDGGSVTLEKVVITAVLVAGAIAVGAILVARATDGAESIELP